MRNHIALCIVGILLVIPAAAVAGGPALSPADFLSFLDGGAGLPSAWSGIWSQQIDIYDCSTEVLLYSGTNTDTTCAGDPTFVTDPGVTLDCSGTVTDTNIDMDCSWSFEEPAGCVVSNTLSIVGTRDSNSYQMTSTMTATYLGETCDYVGEICMRSVISGTRIGPQPPTCGSPVEAATWGRVKALYR